METNDEQSVQSNIGVAGINAGEHSKSSHKHAAAIIDSDTVSNAGVGASVQNSEQEKQKDQTLASRIGTYNTMRKSTNSARQVLKGTQRELEKLSKDLEHRQNILDNYEQIVSEQTQALTQAQSSQAASQKEQTSLQEQLKSAQNTLDQTKAKNKKELEPVQADVDEAKRAVRAQEKELAHLQKERDNAARALYDIKRKAEEHGGARGAEYDSALEKNNLKMQEVEQAHVKLGELRNAYSQKKAALESKQTQISEEQKPLYEAVENLQSRIKSEKRNISRQEKFITDAQNALNEANEIHSDPQVTVDLKQKVQQLTQTANEQQEHYSQLKAQMQDAGKKAHIGKIAACGIIVLIAVIAIVIIVLFAGR